ncbi:hypothetical protein JW711_00845 [Candidatus Woesearchaeota archaeon]|nr:hypothetical protein [Candidatus Woesearchaeota archaeon]
MRKNRILGTLGLILVVFMLFFVLSASYAAAEDDYVCAIYFTGAGCPHCANAKPVIEKVVEDTPNLVLIKYEIHNSPENAPLLNEYADQYGIYPGIPLIVFGKDDYLQGDKDIISGLKNHVDALGSNPCPLVDGSSMDASVLDKSTLPGKIDYLACGDAVVANTPFDIQGSALNESCEEPLPGVDLTVVKVLSLASVDAINPCVFAILLWILLAILTANPGSKKKVLYSGLAFSAAVFLLYFAYGLLIVLFFQLVQAMVAIKIYLYKAMAVFAIVLGIVNLMDYFSYMPGRLGTEMPLLFRPKVKKIVNKVTSPLGAFTVGAFVTLFLLPCTIGPYIIAGGILSSMSLMSTLPWLVLYNIVFVLPILIVSLLVYGGVSSIEKASSWKDTNIRYIHLFEGVITLLLGLAMLFGWLGL